jgi:hypothetical protein
MECSQLRHKNMGALSCDRIIESDMRTKLRH